MFLDSWYEMKKKSKNLI